MSSIFLTILNMSITASYVIAVIIIIRLLLRNAPKKYSYVLWSVAAFRFAIPFSFESVFSIFTFKPFDLTKAQSFSGGYLSYVQPADISGGETQLTTGIPALNSVVDTTLNAAPEASIPISSVISVLAYIWLAGFALFIIYGVVSYIIIRTKLSNAVRLRDNIYQSDSVNSPFILGIINPKIYIPFDMDSASYDYVISHEKHHIKRFDYIVKIFAYILLCVHWFNPFCWLAFSLMSKDMEMSCDEKVLADNSSIKKVYSNALLSFSTNKKFPSPSPLSFGEGNIKSRIKNILKFKKPKTFVTVTAILLCFAVIVGCSANPLIKNKDSNSNSYINTVPTERFSIGKVLAESYLLSSIMFTGEGEIEFDGDTLIVPEDNVTTDDFDEGDVNYNDLDMFTENQIDAIFKGKKNLKQRTYYTGRELNIETPIYTIYYENEVPFAIQDGWRIFDLLPSTENLDEAVTQAILNIKKNNDVKCDYSVESHYTFLTEKGDLNGNNILGSVTVYAYAYYADLNYDGYLKEAEKFVSPVALTFALNDDGSYTYQEYWEPDSDKIFDKELDQHFPQQVISQIEYHSDIERSLAQSAYKEVIENTDYNHDIANLFDSISKGSKALSSYPKGYNELINYGEYTIRYIYSEFIKGGQTGDKGLAMQQVMVDLLAYDAIEYNATDGQNYFDHLLIYYNNIFREATDLEEYLNLIKEDDPYIYILYEMTNKQG